MTDDSSESFEKGLFGNRKNKSDGETPKGGETPNDAKKPRLRERIKGVFKGNKDSKENDGEEKKVDESSTPNDTEIKENNPAPEQSPNDEGQGQNPEADQSPEQPPEGEGQEQPSEADQTPEQPPEDEVQRPRPPQRPRREIKHPSSHRAMERKRRSMMCPREHPMSKGAAMTSV